MSHFEAKFLQSQQMTMGLNKGLKSCVVEVVVPQTLQFALNPLGTSLEDSEYRA